jgi:hypothetical protein
MGVKELSEVRPPMTGPPDNMLRRAWLEFSCTSLAGSYADMSRYGRSLRKDVLVECNPGGVGDRIRAPVDHGRLLQGGEAFWDEGRSPGFRGGHLQSRIRTYKVARLMQNMAFAYAISPLEMAESMAFNRDCLGCVCWFEYDRIVAKPGSKDPVSKDLRPFIRFFHQRRDLLRDTTVVADVAVLRSFPSQVFADSKYANLTAAAEQALIENRAPFQIIYDHHLADLRRYRVLMLAGCVAMANGQAEQITKFVKSGGRLCIVGPLATHDEWMRPREKPALGSIPSAQVLRIGESDSVVEAVGELCGQKLSLSVEGPKGLCAELMEQAGRRLVHLVNYRENEPAHKITVQLRIPTGKKAKGVALVSPEHEADIDLSFDQQGDAVRFTVPKVGIYEIAVVALE